MKRHVLMYGLIGGILIAALKWTEYRFLVVEHSIEIYGGLTRGDLCRSWHLAWPQANRKTADNCCEGGPCPRRRTVHPGREENERISTLPAASLKSLN